MPDHRTLAGHPLPTADGVTSADASSRGRLRAVLGVAGRLLTSRAVRWGFVVAAVALGGYAVASRWAAIQAALARMGPLTVAGAMASVLLAMFASMQVWRVLLAALGSPLPIRTGARILFVGQLGKYLPGSLWTVVAQMEMGREHHVPRHHSASASALALIVSVLAGLLAALVTLPFVAGATPYRWAFLAAPVLLACVYPRFLNALLARVFALTRRPALERPLTGRAIAAAFGWSLASWVSYGLQIWLLATRLGGPKGELALLGVGGFAFAWSVGFLVVFVPAGAGVREVLLVALLGPVIGTGAATAVALISRALTTAGDLLAAAVAVRAGRTRAIPGQEPGDAGGALS